MLNPESESVSSPSKRRAFASPAKKKKVDPQSVFNWEPVEILSHETDVIEKNNREEMLEIDRIRNDFNKRKAREAKERKRLKELQKQQGKKGSSSVNSSTMEIAGSPGVYEGGYSPSIRSTVSETAEEPKNSGKKGDSFQNMTFDFKGKSIKMRQPALKPLDDGITFMDY
jgi:hypothetical protein